MIVAVKEKNCSFATIKPSCTAVLSVAKELDPGILLLGFFKVSFTYLAMFGQTSRALSATFLSSI